MSTGRDFLSDLHSTDPWIAAITPKRIEAALNGFSLPLTDGWNLSSLTSKIQYVANAARVDPPQGDADAIAELQRLADKAKALHRAISLMGQTAEMAAFWEVFRYLDENRNVDRIDYRDDYMPLMLHPLETIANILARAASQTATQRKQVAGWQRKHDQDRRIYFAVALTPIFQSAFDTPARANNWRAAYGEEHPWPDFYRRIYGVLRPEVERLNLGEVLQEAARQFPRVEALKQRLEEQEASRPIDSGK